MVLHNEVLIIGLIVMVLCGAGVALAAKNYLESAVVLAMLTLIVFGSLVTLIMLDTARLCA